MDQNSEHPKGLPPLHTGAPRHSSASALSNSNTNLASSGGGDVGVGSTSRAPAHRHTDKLKGDWPLPPLRRRPLTSVPLEQARHISRSLSFLLGEPENEPVGEEEPPPSHMLPPLSPHIPPLLTRTVTSPHFPGQAKCGVCCGLLITPLTTLTIFITECAVKCWQGYLSGIMAGEITFLRIVLCV